MHFPLLPLKILLKYQQKYLFFKYFCWYFNKGKGAYTETVSPSLWTEHICNEWGHLLTPLCGQMAEPVMCDGRAVGWLTNRDSLGTRSLYVFPASCFLEPLSNSSFLPFLISLSTSPGNHWSDCLFCFVLSQSMHFSFLEFSMHLFLLLYPFFHSA